MSDVLLRRRPSVLWLYSLRGVLVCSPDGDDVQLLSAPGDVLWELLGEPLTLSRLSAELAVLFGTEVDQVRSDVDVTVARLEAIGVIESVAADVGFA